MFALKLVLGGYFGFCDYDGLVALYWFLDLFD